MERQILTPAYAGALAALLLWGCRREPDSPADPPPRRQGRTAVRFADVTAAAGIHFKHTSGLSDFLYRNEEDGSFREIGLAAGAAYNEAGKPEGGMGIDIADTDGDGHLEILVTNFQWESNTLYQGKRDGLWRDRSTASGLGAPSFDRLAFGVNFFDFDRDGDPDLYVANGQIDDNIADLAVL